MLRRPPLHYPARPFHHFLEDAADTAPENIAVRAGTEVATFRELDGAANALATALVSAGVAPGDRVALLLGNSIEFAVALFAVSKSGAAAVMLNPRWTRTEVDAALMLTEPVAIVADPGAIDLLNGAPPIRIAAGQDAPVDWRSLWDLVQDNPGQRPDLAVDDWGDLEAVLPFSSGTTGLPKAAVHTHASIVAATLQWKAAGGMRDDDRMLLFLPAFHVYGVITLAAAIASRARLHLLQRFDRETVLDLIERERISLTFGAAPVALSLAEDERLDRRDLSSLRYICWGATPMDERVAEDVTRRTGVPWLHAYGSTEAPLMHCNPVEHPDLCRLDTPGMPVSDLEVRVVDIDTREVLANGHTGEIVVRGPQLIRGYLPTSADADTFDDGWLRTGDIGWQERDGWVHIVDRAKEMIKVNAFQVAPAELEHLLQAHPAVLDCGVFGMTDQRTGEAPWAAVRLDPRAAVSAEALAEWVNEQVARYKRVKTVVIVDEIPRTASGKVLRRTLRQQFARLDQETDVMSRAERPTDTMRKRGETWRSI